MRRRPRPVAVPGPSIARKLRSVALLGPLVVSLLSTTCGSDDGLPAVEGPASAQLELVATEMRYTPSSVAVGRGDVPVVLRNDGQVIHDLRIDGKPALLVEAGPGKTAAATWNLDKGRYRIYCSLPGHREAGMNGLLEVR